MGYTNYWHQHDDFTCHEWTQIKKFYHGLKLIHGGGQFNEADHTFNDETIHDDFIVLNGTKGQDCETFVLRKYRHDQKDKNEYYNFCKTNRNPYDAIVWSLLCFARYVKHDRTKFEIANDDGEGSGKNIL